MKVNKCVIYLLLFPLFIAFPSHAAVLPGAGEWSGWTMAGDVQDTGNPQFQYAAPAVVSYFSSTPYYYNIYSFNTANGGKRAHEGFYL